MPRGRQFSPIEEDLIIDNIDLTIAELEALFKEHGYDRSRKSINRKIEKLRSEGKVGYRDKTTIRRSHKQKNRKKPSETVIDEGFGKGFDGPGFGEGFSGGTFSDEE